MATTETNPWARLGASYNEASVRGTMDAADLLGWNVRKARLKTENGTLAPRDTLATIRDNPLTGEEEILGVVGDRYSVVQNEDLIEVLDLVAEDLAAEPVAAGEINGGRGAFVTLESATPLLLGSDYEADCYITVLTTHDGSRPTSVVFTPVERTTGAVLNVDVGGHTRGHAGSVKVRHTDAGGISAVAVSHDALKASMHYFSALENILTESFAPAEMTPEVQETILEELLGTTSESESWIARSEDRKSAARACIQNAGGATLLDGLLGFFQFLDYERELRPRGGLDPEHARSLRSLFMTAEKAKAWRTFTRFSL